MMEWGEKNTMVGAGIILEDATVRRGELVPLSTGDLTKKKGGGKGEEVEKRRRLKRGGSGAKETKNRTRRKWE